MANLPTPAAVLRLEGRTVQRGPVSFDWGSRLQWKVIRNGEVIATPNARLGESYTHPDAAPGQYEIVLETWQHEGYRSKGLGQYIEISNKVAYRV